MEKFNSQFSPSQEFLINKLKEHDEGQDRMTSEIESLRTQLGTCQAQANEDRDVMKSEMEKLKTKLGASQIQANENQANIKSDIESLKTQLTQANEDRDNMKSELQKLKTKLGASQQTQANENRAIRSGMEKLKTKLGASQTQASEDRSDLENLNTQLGTCQAQVVELESSVHQLENITGSVQDELSSVNATLEDWAATKVFDQCKNMPCKIGSCRNVFEGFRCECSGTLSDVGEQCPIYHQFSHIDNIEWHNNHYYLFITEKKTFPAAKEYCEEKGMTMSSIKSAEENAFVADRIKTLGGGGNSLWWIGGQRHHSDGEKFHWLGEDNAWQPNNNNQEVYNNWDRNEPNSSKGNQDYMCMMSSNGKFHNCVNEAKLHFVCKA